MFNKSIGIAAAVAMLSASSIQAPVTIESRPIANRPRRRRSAVPYGSDWIPRKFMNQNKYCSQDEDRKHNFIRRKYRVRAEQEASRGS